VLRKLLLDIGIFWKNLELEKVGFAYGSLMPSII
jgi:hypothetical protein